jgi:hypothetical protein
MKEIKQNWIDEHWKLFTLILFLVASLVFTLFFGAIAIGVIHLTKSSGVYQMALQEVRSHEQAINILGLPITPGWYVTGSIHIENGDGEAILEIPVKGTQQEGVVKLDATKKDDRWSFNYLLLDVEGSDTDIVIYSDNLCCN